MSLPLGSVQKQSGFRIGRGAGKSTFVQALVHESWHAMQVVASSGAGEKREHPC